MHRKLNRLVAVVIIKSGKGIAEEGSHERAWEAYHAQAGQCLYDGAVALCLLGDAS